MKTKASLYITLLIVTLLFSTCKKTKLDGDYKKLVGTWQWTGGWADNGSSDMKLDLKEKGKYKLYKGSKKIEYGRLVKEGEYLRFISDNFIKKLGHKYLILNTRKILNISDETIGIGQTSCWDCASSGFKKN